MDIFTNKQDSGIDNIRMFKEHNGPHTIAIGGDLPNEVLHKVRELASSETKEVVGGFMFHFEHPNKMLFASSFLLDLLAKK